MKLKTAQKLQAQGRLTHKVMTEQGWYAPGPLKGAPAPFADVSDEDLVVVIPSKVLKKVAKKKVAVAVKAKKVVVAKKSIKSKKKHG